MDISEMQRAEAPRLWFKSIELDCAAPVEQLGIPSFAAAALEEEEAAAATKLNAIRARWAEQRALLAAKARVAYFTRL
jgi:hypothetical protein